MALNLRKSVVQRYWETKNKKFSELCKIVEEHEHWCVDDKDVEEALSKLANVLENGDVSANAILENANSLFLVLAYIKFSKTLRLLTWFDERYKENVSQMLVNMAIENKDESYYRLLLERLLLVKDFSLLNQIYSSDRFNRVNNILNNLKQENK